jgi:threonine/homoserine/homoserine lactone efflux protein
VQHVPAFLVLVAVLVAIPGPAVTLVLERAVAAGWRPALALSAGVFTADLVWVAASVAGITALVVASGPAFAALRLAGAAYLVYLGLKLLLGRSTTPTSERGSRTPSLHRSYAQGVACDLSNPKTALVFTSVLPQFLTGDAGGLDVAVLGVAFALAGLASLLVWIAVGTATRRALTASRVRDAVLRLSGGVLVIFGVRLALER